MEEKHIERYLCYQVQQAGGVCWKWPAGSGQPDRIVILPGGKIVFVECKSPRGVLSALQKHIHKIMQDLGCTVIVVRSKEEVDEFMEGISDGISISR
jgi:hypothetical protein